MSQPDRIALPTAIHAIVCRWIVYFSLMSNETQPDKYISLALIRRLSLETSPCVGLEELAQLYDYVLELLNKRTGLSPIVVREAEQFHCWLDRHSGDLID